MRLMSWNIQWAKGADGRVEPVRIADYLTAQQPDIIALQEVCNNYPANTGDSFADQPAWFEQAFRQQSGAVWQTLFSPATDRFHPESGLRQQFGNLIATHYPIAEVRHHTLPRPVDAAHPGSPRAALELLLQTPLGWIRFITTHLEYYSTRQRTAQAAYLYRLHEEGCGWHRDPITPPNISDTPLRTLPTTDQTLICGDLNAPPDNPEIMQLLAPAELTCVGLYDGWRLTHPDQPHPPTLGLNTSGFSREQAFCADYLLGSRCTLNRIESFTVDDQVTFSDHQPLIIDFKEPT
ncbi:hypothetical protein D5085_00975 [Ectothiorhodospiraceae bacterium BW-2]|nr:hypothetical protein D5085_00975 [Ectothiorhodospiraceae bacterium BW-2]